MPVTRDQAIAAIAVLGKANSDKFQAMLKANADLMLTAQQTLAAQLSQQSASMDTSGEFIDCLHALGILDLDDVPAAAHIVAVAPPATQPPASPPPAPASPPVQQQPPNQQPNQPANPNKVP